jgi:AcrR family transcriptional regulator
MRAMNLIALQSKEWILEALLLLMDKKSFKDITVKELAEKAGVDRKTFYRHFESKEDVLRIYTDKISTEYVNEIRKHQSLTSYSIGLTYFSVLKKHIAFLKKLERNNLLLFLLQAIDGYMPEVHKFFESHETPNDPLYYWEYVMSYLSGGFWNLSTKWIRDGAKQSPQEMAAIVEKVKAHA